jgi:hypothetical protein
VGDLDLGDRGLSLQLDDARLELPDLVVGHRGVRTEPGTGAAGGEEGGEGDRGDEGGEDRGL